MFPFCSFCYAHHRGLTLTVLKGVYKTVGVRGFLALPFITLGMEKSIYDSTQSWQGIDPTVVPADRGGFPSGGGAAIPSFSLIPVDPVKRARREMRLAAMAAEEEKEADEAKSKSIPEAS